MLEQTLPRLDEAYKTNDDTEGKWEDDNDGEEGEYEENKVSKKYEKTQVMDADEGRGRYERSIKDKMDEWKRHYYQVCLPCFSGVLMKYLL